MIRYQKAPTRQRAECTGVTSRLLFVMRPRQIGRTQSVARQIVNGSPLPSNNRHQRTHAQNHDTRSVNGFRLTSIFRLVGVLA